MNTTRTGSAGARDVVAGSVIQSTPEVRIAFLRKVYTLFGGAMAVWMGTTLLVTFNTTLLEKAIGLMSFGFIGFILLMGAMFFLLRLTANAGTGISLLGLGLFGVLEGFLTAPLVYLALCQGNDQAMFALQNGVLYDGTLELGTGIVTQAFVLTLAVFGGLSTYALTTKRDFLWLRGALWMGFFGLMAIVLLSFFGIGGNIVSGWGFSVAFVLLMGGFVLYDTQNIMKRYPENMAAAAAATLLIDFIIMFKHILMLLMRRD
ncbi:MAG: Bax inhibitor-1 family protein [Planctomycetota bacterium]|jgi:FtsH-binding integral membrane protein|nr:Bax inhibitor-1 family protein [Planctomycetota bacterium]